MNIFILNSLAIVEDYLTEEVYTEVQELANEFDSIYGKNLEAAEFYGASIRKLGMAYYNKSVSESPLTFGDTIKVENSFNSLVLMSKACLDSLACTANLLSGKGLPHKDVNFLDSSFRKTLPDKLQKIFDQETLNSWNYLNDYRDAIMHRTAIMSAAASPKRPETRLDPVRNFVILRDPKTLFFKNRIKSASKYMLKIDKIVDDFTDLATETFIKVSEAIIKPNT